MPTESSHDGKGCRRCTAGQWAHTELQSRHLAGPGHGGSCGYSRGTLTRWREGKEHQEKEGSTVGRARKGGRSQIDGKPNLCCTKLCSLQTKVAHFVFSAIFCRVFHPCHALPPTSLTHTHRLLCLAPARWSEPSSLTQHSLAKQIQWCKTLVINEHELHWIEHLQSEAAYPRWGIRSPHRTAFCCCAHCQAPRSPRQGHQDLASLAGQHFITNTCANTTSRKPEPPWGRLPVLFRRINKRWVY